MANEFRCIRCGYSLASSIAPAYLNIIASLPNWNAQFSARINEPLRYKRLTGVLFAGAIDFIKTIKALEITLSFVANVRSVFDIACVAMCATVFESVGFASTSEEMLCIASFGFAIHLCALSCFVIANGIVATHFELIPFPSYAFGKHIVVAFPSAVGACRRARRVRWHFFRRDCIATTRGEEHRRSERDPIQFAILHDVTPLLFYKIIQTMCAKNIKPYNSQ